MSGRINCFVAFAGLCAFGLFFAQSPVGSLASEIPRPRGVSLSRAALYATTGDEQAIFPCLDGLKRILFTQVILINQCLFLCVF